MALGGGGGESVFFKDVYICSANWSQIINKKQTGTVAHALSPNT